MSSTTREELEHYLAHSRAVQRTVRWIGVAIAALALVVVLAGARGVGVAGLALAAIIAGASTWITAGHIADFERQLAVTARDAPSHPRRP